MCICHRQCQQLRNCRSMCSSAVRILAATAACVAIAAAAVIAATAAALAAGPVAVFCCTCLLLLRLQPDQLAIQPVHTLHIITALLLCLEQAWQHTLTLQHHSQQLRKSALPLLLRQRQQAAQQLL